LNAQIGIRQLRRAAGDTFGDEVFVTRQLLEPTGCEIGIGSAVQKALVDLIQSLVYALGIVFTANGFSVCGK